ncbi:MAG: CARDB domain-containing protein, partial [Candidatus Entotheonellia bacterium]
SSITVSDTTKNKGQALASESTTTFYLSKDAKLDAKDVLLGSRAVPSLSPGASNKGSTALTIPAGTAPGSYNILAVGDGDGVVAESNETNNLLKKAITIR